MASIRTWAPGSTITPTRGVTNFGAIAFRSTFLTFATAPGAAAEPPTETAEVTDSLEAIVAVNKLMRSFTDSFFSSVTSLSFGTYFDSIKR